MAEDPKMARWTDPSDLQFLASEWDLMVGRMGDYPTRRGVFLALSSLSTAYARGQGVRIGTIAAYRRKGTLVLDLTAQVLQWVIENRTDWRYANLVELGFGDASVVRETAGGLMEGSVDRHA
jgi:hypothetical protein